MGKSFAYVSGLDHKKQSKEHHLYSVNYLAMDFAWLEVKCLKCIICDAKW